MIINFKGDITSYYYGKQTFFSKFIIIIAIIIVTPFTFARFSFSSGDLALWLFSIMPYGVRQTASFAGYIAFQAMRTSEAMGYFYLVWSNTDKIHIIFAIALKETQKFITGYNIINKENVILSYIHCATDITFTKSLYHILFLNVY